MERSTVIVTGAFGFIGSNVVKNIVHKDGKVIVVYSNDDLKNWGYLNGLPVEDIIYYKDLDMKIMKNITTLIHLGAISSTTCQDHEALIENNFKYSMKLAKLCNDSHTKFIYASSAATYGHNADNTPESTFPLYPLNLYGQTKLWVDQALLGKKNMWGLRYFNVYGPNENHKDAQSSVISKFTKEISETGSAKLFMNPKIEYDWGTEYRDFVHVEDVAEITAWFALNPNILNKQNNIYNIGTGISTTFKDVAKLVFDKIGKEPKIEWIEIPPDIALQYQNRTCANISKLKNICNINIRPSHIGIPQYVEYLMKNVS